MRICAQEFIDYSRSNITMINMRICAHKFIDCSPRSSTHSVSFLVYTLSTATTAEKLLHILDTSYGVEYVKLTGSYDEATSLVSIRRTSISLSLEVRQPKN